jgi:hypothetical protein
MLWKSMCLSFQFPHKSQCRSSHWFPENLSIIEIVFPWV